MLEYIISLMRIKVILTGAKRDSGYIYGRVCHVLTLPE